MVPVSGRKGAGRRERILRALAGVQSNNYWSSSAHEDDPNNAWDVNLDNGNVDDDDKDNDNFVWPVRGGPWRPRRP